MARETGVAAGSRHVPPPRLASVEGHELGVRRMGMWLVSVGKGVSSGSLIR